MDNEQPHQELVKCVVVGDTAVGKTRLICARACNKHVSLSQLLTTHVPTVWAIDQYRIYKDVLERSWEIVDSVNVSLRLWDTFGDHEKDRRFAYGRSDVVLLCFSITNPVSLRNCGAMWYPEIRRFCPHTPILLVGCKNDLRYMYRDEQYLSYFRDRSPFVRATRKSDLVMPDQGRALAHELGIYYYETSVFSYYGVNEVFENAIRAALMARRQQRFWMTNLKRVQRPLLQAPFRPPKPLSPDVVMTASSYIDNMKTLLQSQIYTDAVIISGSKGYPTHRFMLAACSNAFYRLLTMNMIPFQTPSGELPRSSSESSMVSSLGEATAGEFNEDTEYLIGQDQLKLNSRVWEQIKRRSSWQILPSADINKKPKDLYRDLNHPAFLSIRVVKCDNVKPGQSPTQTVVTLSKLITQAALQQCINFMYTGMIDNSVFENQEVRHAAEFLELHQMTQMLIKIQATQTLMNMEEMFQFHAPMRKRIQEVAVDRGMFSDITFELDDGVHQAHKATLIARCDVMRAMFQGHFRESTAKVIRFPGIKAYAFHKLLCFLYVDTIPHISASRCLNLLELANRLCLTRLVSVVEMRVIEDLNRMLQIDSNEVIEQCLKLVEPVKLHNAHQLADWCMWRLCINYDRVCRSWPRVVRLLHDDNRDYLSENRWPPVWYLKEYDYYQKCCAEQRKEVKPPMKRKQRDDKQLQAQSSSENEDKAVGCLCFSSKSRRGVERVPDASTSLFQSSNSVLQSAQISIDLHDNPL